MGVQSYDLRGPEHVCETFIFMILSGAIRMYWFYYDEVYFFRFVFSVYKQPHISHHSPTLDVVSGNEFRQIGTLRKSVFLYFPHYSLLINPSVFREFSV